MKIPYLNTDFNTLSKKAASSASSEGTQQVNSSGSIKDSIKRAMAIGAMVAAFIGAQAFINNSDYIKQLDNNFVKTNSSYYNTSNLNDFENMETSSIEQDGSVILESANHSYTEPGVEEMINDINANGYNTDYYDVNTEDMPTHPDGEAPNPSLVSEEFINETTQRSYLKTLPEKISKLRKFMINDLVSNYHTPIEDAKTITKAIIDATTVFYGNKPNLDERIKVFYAQKLVESGGKLKPRAGDNGNSFGIFQFQTPTLTELTKKYREFMGYKWISHSDNDIETNSIIKKFGDILNSAGTYNTLNHKVDIAKISQLINANTFKGYDLDLSIEKIKNMTNRQLLSKLLNEPKFNAMATVMLNVINNCRYNNIPSKLGPENDLSLLKETTLVEEINFHSNEAALSFARLIVVLVPHNGQSQLKQSKTDKYSYGPDVAEEYIRFEKMCVKLDKNNNNLIAYDFNNKPKKQS